MFLKTTTRILWWLVASQIFQPPEKKDIQSDTFWRLGGWLVRWLDCQVTGCWWLGGWSLGGWWVEAFCQTTRFQPPLATSHQPPTVM